MARSFTLAARRPDTVRPRQITIEILAGRALAWRTDPQHGGAEADAGAVRPLDDIAGVRLWTEKPKLTPSSGRCEIRFRDGQRLRLYGGLGTGAHDRTQAALYRAFVAALHRAIVAQGDPAPEFKRGLEGGSPAKGWAVGLTLAGLDLALFGFLWANAKDDIAGPIRAMIVVFALAGLIGAAGAGQAVAGRRYDPRDLPDDLFPP